jgi:hypothetical protein
VEPSEFQRDKALTLPTAKESKSWRIINITIFYGKEMFLLLFPFIFHFFLCLQTDVIEMDVIEMDVCTFFMKLGRFPFGNSGNFQGKSPHRQRYCASKVCEIRDIIGGYH